MKLPQQLRQVNHHYPPSASALQVNLLYHSIACPCFVVLPSLHTVSSCISRFDSNMSGSAASFVLTIVSHASAGQNGFGSSFGTPAPQGNGNQEEEEEEAQAPEEPVSLFSIASCCRCVIQQPAGALNYTCSPSYCLLLTILYNWQELYHSVRIIGRTMRSLGSLLCSMSTWGMSGAFFDDHRCHRK